MIPKSSLVGPGYESSHAFEFYEAIGTARVIIPPAAVQRRIVFLGSLPKSQTPRPSRLYFVAANTALGTKSGWIAVIRSVLQDFVREHPFAIDEFAFPSEHLDVNRCSQQRRESREGRREATTSKWEVKHLQAFQSANLRWPAEIDVPEVELAFLTMGPFAHRRFLTGPSGTYV